MEWQSNEVNWRIIEAWFDRTEISEILEFTIKEQQLSFQTTAPDDKARKNFRVNFSCPDSDK